MDNKQPLQSEPLPEGAPLDARVTASGAVVTAADDSASPPPEPPTPIPDAPQIPVVDAKKSNAQVEARNRTSEVILLFLANIAVRFALRPRQPEKQRTDVKSAEFDYMKNVWQRNVATKLQ